MTTASWHKDAVEAGASTSSTPASSAGHATLGAQTYLELTSTPDHSSGAGQGDPPSSGVQLSGYMLDFRVGETGRKYADPLVFAIVAVAYLVFWAPLGLDTGDGGFILGLS